MGALLACDYCPLLFHLDCLDPPLTTAPTHRWMCPNHAEHFMVRGGVSGGIGLWKWMGELCLCKAG